MGKKIQIGNSEAVLLTDNEKDIKNKIIEYLYNTLNLSKYRYEMLNNIQKLKFLQENEHWVSPNYKGHSYFLIFMSIYNKSYCVIINRKKLSYHKNQIDLHTTFIVRLLVNTNSTMFTGSIFEGKIIQKDNDNYFLIQDCFYLMGKKILDMEMEEKMSHLDNILKTHFSVHVIESILSFDHQLYWIKISYFLPLILDIVVLV